MFEYVVLGTPFLFQIPTEPVDRKLSKIETLRLATSYIEHLATQLTAGVQSL
jgi:transcription factor 15